MFAASSEFVDAAEVRRVIVPHPIQDATDEEMRAKADAVLEAVLRALTDGDHC